MHVVAREVDRNNPPEKLRHRLGGAVTAGRVYEVHAVVFSDDGTADYLVADDWGLPQWTSTWLFEVVDPTVPTDWICTARHGGVAMMLLGPEFIAKDEQACSDMAEG